MGEHFEGHLQCEWWTVCFGGDCLASSFVFLFAMPFEAVCAFWLVSLRKEPLGVSFRNYRPPPHLNVSPLRSLWGRKLMRKLSLKPPERIATLQAIWDEQSPANLGPCGTSASMCRIHAVPPVMCFKLCMLLWLMAGGFSHQYWCVCDQLGQPFREEVQWVGAADTHPLFSNIPSSAFKWFCLLSINGQTFICCFTH